MCRRFTPIWSPKRSKAAWISCIKPQGLVVAKSNWRWKMASWNPFILSVGVMGTCKAFPNWWRGCVRQMWLPDWKAYVVEWSPLRVPTSWRRLWSRLCHTPDGMMAEESLANFIPRRILRDLWECRICTSILWHSSSPQTKKQIAHTCVCRCCNLFFFTPSKTGKGISAFQELFWIYRMDALGDKNSSLEFEGGILHIYFIGLDAFRCPLFHARKILEASELLHCS